MVKRATNIHEINPFVSLSPQVVTLSNQIQDLTAREPFSSQESAMVANTSYSGEGVEQENYQYINNQNYNYAFKQFANSLSP